MRFPTLPPNFVTLMNPSPQGHSLPAMQETRIRSLGREDPLEKAVATHSSILAWKSHGHEPGGLQAMGSQRVGHY